MADATVIITDTERNVSRTLTTNTAGEYNAPNLLPGMYKVRAEAKGFKVTERANIILEVGGELRVDLTMQPGEVTQTITVTEALPMVETTNAELGGTLQRQVIENLPLNGRNYQNMLQLRPGVTIYPGGAGKAQSANGQRPTDNIYMVNGVMVSDPWVSQSMYGNVLAAGDQGTILPVDAIDEFKTEENPRAEYGWKPGAIVDVGVKSGTNAIHGSGYAYVRDTAFDARDYFNLASGPLAAPKAPMALEQYGGTVGGPIKKDKLFYFANFEGQHYAIGNPVINGVTPTTANLIAACTHALAAPAPVTGSASGTGLSLLSASMAGLTPTCAIDPSKTTLDPGGLKFQGLFPVNTGTVPVDLVNVNGIYGGMAKVDYHASDKHQLEGMYFFSQGNGIQADAPASQVSNAWLTTQHARVQVASGSWVWTPKTTMVNELRVGYGHNFWEYESPDHTQDPANYTFNGVKYEIPTGVTNPFDFGAPRIDMTGSPGACITCIGQLWPKVIGPTSVVQILEHMSIIHGKHAFMFGGEMFLNRAVNDETANAKGRLRFRGLNNFMEGNLNRAYLLIGDAKRDLTNQAYAGFLQDDWRVTPRLTVNLGVRYELNTVVKERNGQQGNFDPILGIIQSDNPYHGDHNNFSPRVGFAWDMRGNGKTVIRAGGGIIYEQLGMDVLNGQGNLLGLRTIPTGLPLFNNGSTTPLPTVGNINLQSLAFLAGSTALAPISAAWQAFNPALPVAGQATLFSGVATPACGDGSTLPPGYAAAPGPCEVLGVNPNLRQAYVSTWNLGIQQALTNSLSLEIGYVGNHGTKLLGKLNYNQPPPGAGWAGQIAACDGSAPCLEGLSSPDTNAEQLARPFTAPCTNIPGATGPNAATRVFNPNNTCLSYLSYVTIIGNDYASNYNGLQATVTGRNYHGLTFTAGYTYSHALGDASDQGTSSNFPPPQNVYSPLINPNNVPAGSLYNLRQQLYAATDFDIRHRFTLSLNYAIPGKKGYGQMLEGWSLNSIVLISSGLPWGLTDVTDDFSGTGAIGTNGTSQTHAEQWNFYGNPSDFTPVHGWTDTNGGFEAGGGGLPYFGGTSNATCLAKSRALGPLAIASLSNLGCYAVGTSILIPPAFGSYGTTPQNLFRDAGYRNWDFSVAKMFRFRERLNVQGRAEFFNVLNHPTFANPTGGPGGLTGGSDPSSQPFGSPCGGIFVTPDTCSSNPLIGSGGPRAIQLGMKLSW